MVVLDRILSTQTFNILKAENAELGIQLAKQHRPNLILMDITLPGMDGFEALQVLRDDLATKKIPVIAVTASTLYEQETYLEAGFADLIMKPVRIGKFVTVLKKYAVWNGAVI